MCNYKKLASQSIYDKLNDKYQDQNLTDCTH